MTDFKDHPPTIGELSTAHCVSWIEIE